MVALLFATDASMSDKTAKELAREFVSKNGSILGTGTAALERAFVTGYEAHRKSLSDDFYCPEVLHIVTLCGSTRFYEAFQKANFEETMKGHIVLSVGFYPHAQEKAHGEDVGITAEQKAMLDKLHLRKIDISDEILVLNVDGYVGESTTNEILYAHKLGKTIRWWEPKIPIQFQKLR